MCPSKWILKGLLSQITEGTAEMLDLKLGYVFCLYGQLALGEMVLYVWEKRCCTKQLSNSSHMPNLINLQDFWPMAELTLTSADSLLWVKSSIKPQCCLLLRWRMGDGLFQQLLLCYTHWVENKELCKNAWKQTVIWRLTILFPQEFTGFWYILDLIQRKRLSGAHQPLMLLV